MGEFRSHRQLSVDASRKGVMAKKTVLLCGPSVNAIGGGPTHIRNLLASPLRDRYQLIHFEIGSRGRESPANDEKLSRRLLRIVFSPLLLATVILRTRPRVVHLNSSMNHKAFWRDAVYLLVCKSLGRRVLIQIHSGTAAEFCAALWMRLVVRTVMSCCDALVVIAKSQQHDFEELGIGERLWIIPNGVDVMQYRGACERTHSGTIRRMVFMGRLIRQKGIFEAMEAVRILRAEEGFQNLELRIAGSGEAREEIEHWVKERSMEGCIKLVGALHGVEKVEFLRQADVFVFPSYHLEGLPYGLVESLAAGTPVIASKVGGIPDVVVDGMNGMLIYPKDPRQVVEAVRKLARAKENLQTICANCSGSVLDEFGFEKFAARFEELYERLRA